MQTFQILSSAFSNPLPQILDSSKLKEFGVDFKSDENGRKFSKRVDNTVRKGEIARYEQFFSLPQCFQKIFTADTLKPGLVSERVKYMYNWNNQICKRNCSGKRIKCFLTLYQMTTF